LNHLDQTTLYPKVSLSGNQRSFIYVNNMAGGCPQFLVSLLPIASVDARTETLFGLYSQQPGPLGESVLLLTC
jgi:hypothetical protein